MWICWVLEVFNVFFLVSGILLQVSVGFPCFFSGSLIGSAGSWRFSVGFPGPLSGFNSSWKFSELFLVTCFLEILHWFFLVPDVVMLVPGGFQCVFLVTCLILLVPGGHSWLSWFLVRFCWLLRPGCDWVILVPCLNAWLLILIRQCYFKLLSGNSSQRNIPR